jgi:hypothetical protein
MVFEFFTLSFLKGFTNNQDLKIKQPHKTPELKPSEYTPKIIERIRKIQSSEDFMKIQVPWIL